MTDPHEPEDLLEVIKTETRAGAREGGKEAKIRFLDRRLVLIYIFMVLMAANSAGFEIQSHSGCMSERSVVQKFDGYLKKQITLVEKRKDLSPSVKQAAIANYKSAAVPVPNCPALVVP